MKTIDHFNYGHLPAGPLRDTSQLVHELATFMNDILPEGAEKAAGLRKLLEAKDCFVRSVLDNRDHVVAKLTQKEEEKN